MSFTQFLFDDSHLYGRQGTERAYGKPERVGVFTQDDFSTDYDSPFVFQKGGKYIMLYWGTQRSSGNAFLMAAESADGINFRPYDCSCLNNGKNFPRNAIMLFVSGQEPAAVFEDPLADASQRYKMIMTYLDFGERYGAYASLFASPDLIHWSEILHEIPGFVSEPVGGAFYNRAKKCITLIHRRTWGCRSVGYQDTADFKKYTDFELCMLPDSLDKPLDEIYGMPSFYVNGIYIGFTLIYACNEPSRGAKFMPGNIYPQLSYSLDGHHWQRSLRESFLPDYIGQPSLFWLNSMTELPCGDVLLYAAQSDEAHGEAFRNHKSGKIIVYRMRRNGFICLKSKENAVVTTREYLFGGGEIEINLKTSKATAAILVSESTEDDDNPLGFTHTVPGFDHCDCEPFSGDSQSWVPVFKGGSTDKFKGKTVAIEIRFTDGELYTVSGNIRPLINTEGARWRLRGRI